MTAYTIQTASSEHTRDREDLLTHVMRAWPWPWPHSGVRSNHACEGSSMPMWDAFFEGRLVGFASCHGPEDAPNARSTVSLPYPLVDPDHAQAGRLLLGRVIDRAEAKRADIVEVSAQVLSPDEREIVEGLGFVPSSQTPLGTKMYYTYDLSRGPLPIPQDHVEPVDLARDVDRLAPVVNKWCVNWSLERCRKHLVEDPARSDVLAHVMVRDGDEIAAACYVKPNFLKTKTLAAAYYIYALRAEHLRPLIAAAIDACIARGFETLLVDLMHEHRQYEHDYEALGFDKAADYVVFEKPLRPQNEKGGSTP